jgi:1-deoxy-D-xylulose-5-phosphate synthase
VMLTDAVERASGPVAIRWPKTPARHAAASEIGCGRNARKVAEGRDVCILAIGKMVEAAEEAVALLATRDVHPTVWDARIVPLDARMLADARRHALVVTVEDGIAEGGVGSLVGGALARAEGGPSPAVVMLGTPLAYLPHGKPTDLLANLGLDGPGIAAAVLKAMDPRP